MAARNQAAEQATDKTTPDAPEPTVAQANPTTDDGAPSAALAAAQQAAVEVPVVNLDTPSED